MKEPHMQKVARKYIKEENNMQTSRQIFEKIIPRHKKILVHPIV